ncbi:uncharacterized protein LOC143429262 [Xylocopa sonorina]|uniref:uncharacterized protein LOC143429262 n=1 Tax=Xylocopa sonorina TaxID=1818115 RepID=UPI00403B0A1A
MVCWDKLRPLVEELKCHPKLPVYEPEYVILLTRIIVNTEIGIKIQNSMIYMDGLKSKQAISTEAACICPQLNTYITSSLNKKASIYTAETTAIIMAINLAIQNLTQHYIIWTDSLSTVQALNSNDHKTNFDHRIIKIKTLIHKYHRLINIGSIQIYWLPSHLGIEGNEMADSAARKAAKQHPDQHVKINHSDLYPQLRKCGKTQETPGLRNQQPKERNTFKNTMRLEEGLVPWYTYAKTTYNLDI